MCFFAAASTFQYLLPILYSIASIYFPIPFFTTAFHCFLLLLLYFTFFLFLPTFITAFFFHFLVSFYQMFSIYNSTNLFLFLTTFFNIFYNYFILDTTLILAIKTQLWHQNGIDYLFNNLICTNSTEIKYFMLEENILHVTWQLFLS